MDFKALKDNDLKFDSLQHSAENNNEQFKILLNDIKNTLNTNEEYKNRLSKILTSEDELIKAAPWVYKVLKDWKICSSCTSFSSCPKKSARGNILNLVKNGDYYEVKTYICNKKQNAMTYVKNFIHVDCDPFSFFLSSGKLGNITNKKSASTFFQTILIINSLNSAKNLYSDKGIIIVSENENRKFLSYYSCLQAILNNKKTSFFDGEISFNNFDAEDLNSYLREIESSELIVFDNFDKSFFSYQFIKDYLPRLLQTATSSGRTLLIFSSKPVTPLVDIYRSALQAKNILNKFLKHTVNDPVLFKI